MKNKIKARMRKQIYRAAKIREYFGVSPAIVNSDLWVAGMIKKCNKGEMSVNYMISQIMFYLIESIGSRK